MSYHQSLEKMAASQHPNKCYTFDQPRRQVFSLPESFTNYIFKNYSAKGYQKLTMACKKFFGENRLVVVDTVKSDFAGSRAYSGLKDQGIYLNRWKGNKPKLWITRDMIIHLGSSYILKYLYRFDGEYLNLNNISLEIYSKLMTSKNIRKADLYNVTVLHNDGSLVATQDLLKLASVKYLRLYVQKFY